MTPATRFRVLTVVASVAAGIIAALLTGLVEVTPSGLVGAAWYGYPFSWLRKLVIAPQYNPWRVDAPNLALDIGFWSVVALAVALWAAVLLARRPAAPDTR